MNSAELLIAALEYYSIPILKEEANIIVVDRGYDIEVEMNGLYRLRSDGQVVAPFDDVDELCRFILM